MNRWPINGLNGLVEVVTPHRVESNIYCMQLQPPSHRPINGHTAHHPHNLQLQRAPVLDQAKCRTQISTPLGSQASIWTAHGLLARRPNQQYQQLLSKLYSIVVYTSIYLAIDTGHGTNGTCRLIFVLLILHLMSGVPTWHICQQQSKKNLGF